MGRGKNYTPEEKQYIRDNAGVLETTAIAKYLNRSVSSVRTMAQRLDAPIRNDYYTPGEQNYIREWASKKPWHEIASDLGRTELGVSVWASKHEISGSQAHPQNRSKFDETRECGGLFCHKKFEIRRYKQQYCSQKCEQTSRVYRKYSITKEEWWRLFDSQGQSCVCGKTEEKKWSLDHDHLCCPYGSSCGKCIRGILCSECNLLLGKVRDSSDTLRKLADYLDRNVTRV